MPSDHEQQAIRRRWKREGAIVLALALPGIVLASVSSGYTALQLVGIGLMSIAGVAGVSFVFYEIGRSEDRERAVALGTPAADDRRDDEEGTDRVRARRPSRRGEHRRGGRGGH